MTPAPVTIKKSKSARDFFLKLASPLSYKSQPLEIDQTPITPISQVFQTADLAEIKSPPTPAQYNLIADDIPQLLLPPRISLLMHPKILEFEIDSFEQTSTPIKGETRLTTRKRRNVDEPESVKRRSEDSVDSIFDNAYHSDGEDLGYYLKKASGSVSRPGSFFDKESSIFITQADIEIFTKYDTSNPNPQSNTFMESFLDVYDGQINDHTTNQQQLVNLEELQSEQHQQQQQQQENNLSLNNQAGLEINDEIYQLELMLIKEKHNYIMKKQQRQINHLQKLLSYQNQINQQLVNQMSANNTDDNSSNNKLLPPFSMNYPHKRTNTNTDTHIDIDVDIYVDDNKSTVSSADSIMSRNLDIHNPNYQRIHNNNSDGNNTVETRNYSSTSSLRSHFVNDYCKINC